MAAYSISIVPRVSVVNNKEEIVKKILDWLFSLNVVSPDKTDCILSMEEYGYPIGEGANKVVKLPQELRLDLNANGLEVVTKRNIFTTFQYGLDSLICPNCKQDISKEDWDYFNEWASAESNNLTCPKCLKGEEIHNFKFEPKWGFSDLGFIFWSWPEFKEEFIEDFEHKIGAKVDVVYARI